METPRNEVPGWLQGAQAAETCCPIVELRQYTLHPGKRDALIELFDREFVESQEALGMKIVGQFRDLDKPDRFVWLRGFPDMPRRAIALQAFYSGPVWKAHRAAANETMIDSDNVLLLRPARSDLGFPKGEGTRPPARAREVPKGLVIATIYYFDGPPDVDFTEFFVTTLRPALTESGTSVLASFETERSENNFPALPVREGEHVFVWFSRFPDAAAHDRQAAALARSRRWREEVSPQLTRRLKGPPEVLRLSPTARSELCA